MIIASGTACMVQLKVHLDVMMECASQNLCVVMEVLIVMAGKMNQHVGIENQMEDVLLGQLTLMAIAMAISTPMIIASGTACMVQLKFHLDVMMECASQNLCVVMEVLIVMAGKMNQHVEIKGRKNQWRSV